MSNKQNLKVSIILVSYNQGSFIETAINSFVKQSYDNKELIIIDGGSTDNTLKIIEKFKKHISILITENDRGMYHARNKGIMLSSGDIIGFLNCDDLLLENTLEKVVDLFNTSEKISMLFGITNAMDVNGNVLEKINWGNFQLTTKNYFFTMKTIPDQSTFYRRDTFSIVGIYNTSYKFGADTELKCRIIQHQLGVLQTNEIFAYWRLHENTLTHRSDLKWERLKEAIIINKKYSRTFFSYYNIRLLFYYTFVELIKKIRNI